MCRRFIAQKRGSFDNGRRIILTLARPRKARIDLWFFRTTGIILVGLTLLAGAIVLGMTLLRH